MGTASNKQKKEKKAERNSGARKSGKKSNAETSEGLRPLPRPLPRPRLKLHGPAPPSNLEPAPERLDTAEETAAADALVSLGKEKPHKKKNSEFEARMDQIFVATVPGVSASDLGEDSDEEQASEDDKEDQGRDLDSIESSDDSDDSESDSDSDEEILASGGTIS